MVKFGNSWDSILDGEFEKEYYLELREFLKREYSSRIIYPDMYDIFHAMQKTAYEDVKAVILGQDPYHEPGQAHGLCFSVQKGVKPPPSLVNIFRELHEETGAAIPSHGCLESWAEQGVLLLNTVLTVRAHQANSHRNKGWETFTDRVISLLNQREKPMVFILWGNPAKAKAALITEPRHKIITGAHPSPLAAHKGFWGGGYFTGTNRFLVDTGQEPIDWEIKDE